MSDEEGEITLFDCKYNAPHEWYIVGVENERLIYRCPNCDRCKKETIQWVER